MTFTALVGLVLARRSWMYEKSSNIYRGRFLVVVVNSIGVVMIENKSVWATADANNHLSYALRVCSSNKLTLWDQIIKRTVSL